MIQPTLHNLGFHKWTAIVNMLESHHQSRCEIQVLGCLLLSLTPKQLMSAGQMLDVNSCSEWLVLLLPTLPPYNPLAWREIIVNTTEELVNYSCQSVCISLASISIATCGCICIETYTGGNMATDTTLCQVYEIFQLSLGNYKCQFFLSVIILCPLLS